MADKYAVRNIRLCTKDCLCLYVCPTGATDTENSIIDVDKCIGCGDCADACPSGAISMVPKVYPKQQDKTEAVISALKALMRSKSEQENIAAGLPNKLAIAIEKSNLIMAEDIIREAGYMLPQSDNAKEFLQSLLAETGEEAYSEYWLPFLRDFARHLKSKGWFDKTTIAMDEREMEDMQNAIKLIKQADANYKVSLAGNYHQEIEVIYIGFNFGVIVARK